MPVLLTHDILMMQAGKKVEAKEKRLESKLEKEAQKQAANEERARQRAAARAEQRRCPLHRSSMIMCSSFMDVYRAGH